MFFYCAQETRTNVRPSFATHFVRCIVELDAGCSMLESTETTLRLMNGMPRDWFIVEPRWGSLFLYIPTQCALRDTGLWSGTALQFFVVWPPLIQAMET